MLGAIAAYSLFLKKPEIRKEKFLFIRTKYSSFSDCRVHLSHLAFGLSLLLLT